MSSIGRRRSLTTGMALSALLLVPASLAAQQGAVEQGVFVVRLGTDTIAVERFTRQGPALEGDLLTRTPVARLTHYVMALAPDGSVARYEGTMRLLTPIAGQPSEQRVLVTFAGDTGVVRIATGDSARTLRVEDARGAAIFGSASYAQQELVLARARAIGRDTVNLMILPVGVQRTYPVRVVRVAPDAYSLAVNDDPEPPTIRVDAGGRIVGLDAMRTTQKFSIDRVPSADLDAVARRWAAAEAAGQRMGQLSPRDSVKATIGGAHVAVNYGRPGKRGRTVFGPEGKAVVPWGQVWRTGANQATALTTDADLVIGGVTVPAGSYTLFSIPSPSGWKLIINRQTGQWGTEYDAQQDLARVDMTTATLPSPVERFTIAIEPATGAANAQSGVLALRWDTTQATVPFTVKPKGS